MMKRELIARLPLLFGIIEFLIFFFVQIFEVYYELIIVISEIISIIYVNLGNKITVK